ncbi:MAG TPA: hemerythrin domain-containing protein [Flavitalea sp.]|nr:hemerythrin domain-containing protein [Flavitalea sp.]
MKRHSSLAPLSREHHQALILAQLLKKGSPAYKGLPTGIKEKAVYAFNFYQHDLVQHFKEEEIVIEKIQGINSELDQLADEIIEDHKELRQLFDQVNTSTDVDAHLDLLGHKLEQHIRKEERVFFPMIQQYCNEKILNEIEALLSI